MGRVYNALVKADRLQGRERPIGRPALRGSATPGNLPGRSDRSRDEDATKDIKIFRTPGAPITTDENAETIFSFNFDSAATAPIFQSDGGFNLTERFAAPPAAEPLKARPSNESFIARPSGASFPAPSVEKPARTSPVVASHASRPSSSVFEEPRKIASISSLTIDPHLVALTSKDALAQERYRTLAVRIINAASRRKLKTVVVTSAEEGEGKSTVATNLAWVMAKRAERRVILIDASMRSPSIGRMLGLASSRGWLNARSDLTSLSDVIVRLDPNGLYVMTSGSQSTEVDRQGAIADMNDALISSRFEKLLAELRLRFDFVVIDAPQILGCASAQHLASIADGTVIVARASVTHRNRVTDALTLVPEDRRIGIVLNESEISEEAAPHKARRLLVERLFGFKK